MMALAAILGVWTMGGSRELSERTLSERQRLAQALGDHLDYVLKENLSTLQDAALRARSGASGADLTALKAALREAYLRTFFTEGVFFVDRTGTLLAIEPQQASRAGEDFSALPAVRGALQGRPEVSSLTPGPRQRLYAAVPVRDWHGELMGAVGGIGDPASPRFRSLLQPLRTGDTTYVDLVDATGTVLASTKEGRALTPSDHGRILATLIEQKKPLVATCHSCHHNNGVPEGDVMAFAPLRFAPWGVNVREVETPVQAETVTLERRLLWVGALTFCAALLFSWGVARSVTRPLAVLTDATQRIARGNLEEPIPSLGEDEVGVLAQSFDQMRVTLKSSLETIAQWNRDLEQRVQNRTRQLEVLNEQLQRKEEMRRELLKKVISAQEDERKRVARELHDETSQASAALLLAIETNSANAQPETREQMRRMKVLADRVLDSIHRLIFDLRPSMLDDLGLASALKSSLETHLEPLGMDVSFDVKGQERRLKPEIETTLFRIAQEAILNIRRHAEAESAKVTLEFGEKEVWLHIEDDGSGFDASEVEQSDDRTRGLGLLGMQERAALVDGTFTVLSQPGKGTRITVRIPVTDGTALGAQR